MLPLPLGSSRVFLRVLLLLLVLLAPTVGRRPARAANPIVYVNINASGDENGSSWADAFLSLQDALLEPPSGAEIWVAAGVYYPDVGFLEGDNNRQSTFHLQNGIALYGGFAGNESSRGARDWETNLTILSGDIDQNDAKDANGIVTDPAAIAGNNAYHVVTASDTDATAILDGFTITAGNANGGFVGDCGPNCGGGLDGINGSLMLANLTFSGNHAAFGGAGMFLDSNSPFLTNVVFSHNRAEYYGGGIYPYIGSNPTLTNVTFSANSAGQFDTEEGGGGGMATYQSDPFLTHVTFSANFAPSGGAMHNRSSAPWLRYVTFQGNYATTDEDGGGGIYTYASQPRLANVTFFGNRADEGGAIHSVNSQPQFVNSVFSGNYASVGGGIYNSGTTAVSLRNVTFSGNQADSASSIYGETGSSVQLFNVVIWGNSATNNQHLTAPSNAVTLRNSLVQGLNPGGTNLNGTDPANDPRFARTVNCGVDGCSDDPNSLPMNEGANDDYGDLRLRGGSPALDAGDNGELPGDLLDVDGDNNTAESLPLDLAGQPRKAALKTVTPVVDLGAYERPNGAPTAKPGGPYNTDEGESIPLNGSASSDDGGIVAYAWDCTADGSADVTAPAPTGSSCSYADSGAYTLRLTVRDILNATGAATTTVAVANVAPTHTPDPDQSTAAGVAKAFNLGSFVDPGAEGSWPVSVDWGDNSALTEFSVSSAGDLPQKSHAYAAPGIYNVVVTVSDGEDEDKGGFQVVVNPAPPGAPRVIAAQPQTATVNEAKDFALGSFSDAGDGPPWAVTIDWNDGSPATQFVANSAGNLANRPHTYSAVGSYDVLVKVSDGELEGSASFQVTVSPANVAEDVKIFLPLLER